MSAGTEEFLTKVPLFQGLDRHHRAALARSMVERSFKPGEDIVTQGHGGIGMFMIRSGRVDVVQERDGQEQHLTTLGPGEYFGEIALLTDHPRTATVRALESTTCLVLTAWNFRAEVRQSGEMAMQLLTAIGERLARSERAASGQGDQAH